MLKRWYTLAFATGAMSIGLAAAVNAEEKAERTGADAMIEEVVVTARRVKKGCKVPLSRYLLTLVIRWIIAVSHSWIRSPSLPPG